MYIVHLIARLNDGGPARVIRYLAGGMQADGERITVIHGDPPEHEPDLADELQRDGLALELLPGFGPTICPVRDFNCLLRLIAALRRLKPDVLHTHTATAGLLGRVAARLLGIPCVHSYHGHVLRNYFSPRFSRILLWLERMLATQCASHALNQHQQQELQHHWRVGHRWHVIPNPVPPLTTTEAPWQEQLAPNRPVVLFLGRLTAIKDLPLFFATLADLNRQHPIQAVISGDGDRRELVEDLARRQPYPVTLTGFVPASEALHRADLLLLTSRNEGQPLAVLEAMAAQVPVVATAVGGLQQWQGHSGISLAPREPQALAQTCVSLLGDAALRQQQTTTAQELIAAMQPAMVINAYRQLYQHLLPRG